MRKNARLWVALASATVIAGVFVGAAMTNGSAQGQSTKRLSVASRVVSGAQASASGTSASKASPEHRTQLALPGLTRPLRDITHVAAGKHNAKRELSRAEALGAIPSSGRTTASRHRDWWRARAAC